MPLNGSGPISIGGSTAGQSINLEFGRTATQQTSMSQLYRGGGIVPNATTNNAIPTSGIISLSQFYGAANRVTVNITIASNQTNYVLNTAKAAGYVAGITDVVLTINSGVYVSSNSTGVFALDVDTSWAAGDTVRINNNGFIVGMGGVGGAGAGFNFGVNIAGSAGSSGGAALRVQRATSISNAGTIGGGGGGGGGGQSGTFATGGKTSINVWLGSGGGGGGRTGATNVSGGAGGAGSATTPGAAGGTGTASSAGGGGAGAVGVPGDSRYSAGNGGAGGGWGTAGSTGTTKGSLVDARLGPYGGGAAGAAVSGNANITWIATGTRLGAIA